MSPWANNLFLQSGISRVEIILSQKKLTRIQLWRRRRAQCRESEISCCEKRSRIRIQRSCCKLSPPLLSRHHLPQVISSVFLFIFVPHFPRFRCLNVLTCYNPERAREHLGGIQDEKSNFNEKAEQEVTTRDKYRVSERNAPPPPPPPPRGYVHVVCVNSSGLSAYSERI